jgi:hypothetical protein
MTLNTVKSIRLSIKTRFTIAFLLRVPVFTLKSGTVSVENHGKWKMWSSHLLLRGHGDAFY